MSQCVTLRAEAVGGGAEGELSVGAESVVRLISSIFGYTSYGVDTTTVACLQKQCVMQVLRSVGYGNGGVAGCGYSCLLRRAALGGGVAGFCNGCSVGSSDLSGCSGALCEDVHASSGSLVDSVEAASGGATCEACGSHDGRNLRGVNAEVEKAPQLSGLARRGVVFEGVVEQSSEQRFCGTDANGLGESAAVACGDADSRREAASGCDAKLAGAKVVVDVDGCSRGHLSFDSQLSRGKNFEKNRKKRLAAKLAKSWAKRGGVTGRASPVGGSGGTVSTVDTRTGVEIEAVQTLAARRVAENKRAEVEAKVAAALAEHKLKALGDKGRTAVVERLAAARYEQRINEARLRAQKSFSASEDSLKSLGSMGSAGELYAKQAIKKSRDDAKTLKYVQDQAKLLLEHASPEVRQMVAEMPAPVYDDEFEVFGDCPSDFDEEQREAYYADLNRTNFELGQIRVASEGHREATPEELLRIKEELAALSVY